MNQDQVKETLLAIQDSPEFFTVIFTGKSSKKVDGLYYPEKREILIHNKNMTTDSQIMYTAIHEYAHHLHFCSSSAPVSSKSHTREFYSILHGLLDKAEEKGVYKNQFKTYPQLESLTKRIKEEYIAKNGSIMKEFGKLLLEAMSLCNEYNINFEDYISRELGFKKTTANTLMKIYSKDIDPRIGFENMAAVSRIGDSTLREQAQAELIRGKSPERVIHSFSPSAKKFNEDPKGVLESERNRLRKTIETLKKKLEAVEAELSQISG